MTQLNLKVQGKVVLRYDMKHKKWNTCGTLQYVRGQRCYVTRKRDVLRMYGANGSLGVSKNILDFLSSIEPVPQIMFKLGRKKPFQIYTTTIDKLLREGAKFVFKNEQDVTYHLMLEELEGIKEQTKLG